MNKLKNKLRAAVAIAMTLIVGFSANAHDFGSGGIFYNITSSSSKTVEVTYRGGYPLSYSGEYSGIVVIPESVTYRGVEYSVTSIGEYAFFDCSGLTSVTIGNSVTSIGDWAFEYCSGLTSIEIPNSVTSIVRSAFVNCSGLTSVVVEEGNSVYDSRENCNAIIETETNKLIVGCKNSFIPNSVTSIGESAFSGCSGLTSIEIPNSVTSICEGAFSGCSGLTSIVVEEGNSVYDSRENCNAIIETETNKLISGCKNSFIPNSVTSIGNKAFAGCSGLTSIEIPNSVTSIGDYAFNSCTGLTSITIGNSVTSIGRYAFYYCSGLTSVVWNAIKCNDFPADKYHENGPFWDISTKITSFTFGDAVQHIPANLCYEMSKLTTIEIPNSVTSIGERAFEYCSGLTSVTIGNSVTSIGYRAFSSCSGLTSVTIGNSVTSIGAYAFYGCSGLTSVTIGNSVTSIGAYAFYGCSGLTSVKCMSEEPPTIQSNTFDQGDKSIPLYVPYGCKSAYQEAEYWNEFTNIIEMEPEVVVAESITLDKTEISLYVAETTELIATILPEHTTNKNVIWSSLDESIATVDENGLVNAIAAGTATIMATTQDGSNLYATCDVTVKQVALNVGATFEYGNLRYEVTVAGKEVAVAKYEDKKYEGDIIIMESVIIYGVEYSVTSIRDYAFSGCSGLTSIVIPNSVTSIGNSAFERCSGLTSVTIGNSVTTIGVRAFGECSGLTSIEIPNSVISVGNYAFYHCDGLTNVTIGNSVTSIGERAFYYCNGLKNIYINDLKAYCNIEFGDDYANPVYNAENLYLNDSLIEDLVIPEGITKISERLFNGLNHIKTVTIPNSVISVGNYAFSGCSGLTSIEIPNSVTSIGKHAFSNCIGLINVTIGNSVTLISDCAFYQCWDLTNVYISDLDAYCNIEFVDDGANPVYYAKNLYLNGSLIEDLVIPEGITKISDYLFKGLNHIKTVTIPNSVTSIGRGAFAYCSGLTSVTIGNSVTSIGNEAFRECKSLESIDIPNSVTSIGNSAFFNIAVLKSVTLGNSVTSIGKSAFGWCPNITGVLTLPASLTSIGDEAFGDTKYKVCIALNEEPVTIFSSSLPTLETLVVPFGSKEAYEAAEYWKEAENIIEEGSCDIEVTNLTGGKLMTVIATEARQTPALVTGMKVSGTLNDTDLAAIKSNMTSLLRLDISETDYQALPDKAFKDKLTLMDIKLPNGLKSIGAEAFSGCMALNDTVIIPKTVTEISNSAFYNCISVPAIILSEGLNTIGNNAFQYCTSLTSIAVPNSVTAIGSSAFSGCGNIVSATLPDKLTSITSNLFYNCKNLEEFNFPTAITTIGSSAFYGCSKLDLIDLSACDKLTTIGNNAFENCSNIATINFPSSLESIGASAFSNCRSLLQMSVPTATPPTIADDAKPFYHVDNLACVLSIPGDSMVDYLIAQYWGAFVSVAQKEEIDVEIGTEEEIEKGDHHGPGHKHHEGCHVHFHKGPQTPEPPHGPHHAPGIRRAQAEDEQVETVANAISYNGSSVFVEGEECVTFVLTPQEGYEIEKVLYGGEDVTAQVVNNRFTTPVAEAGGVKKLQVILVGGPLYDLGDANGDLSVNVTDVVAVTNYILGSSSENFQSEAADANGDGEINVTDVVAVTNIILGVTNVNGMPAESDVSTSSELTLTDNGINDNGIQTIDVALFNDRSFTAFQTEVTLPYGVELQDVVLSERASTSHSVSFAKVGDNRYRIVSFSFANEPYSGSNGKLFTLVVNTIYNVENGALEMNDILFTTPNAIGFYLDNVVMEVSGTTFVETLPTATNIYEYVGNIIIESPKDCVSVIANIDGRARNVETVAGVNTYAVSEKGIYIVRSNNKVVKVIVK